MPGKEYECKECGRAFLVDGEKKSEPKCLSCEGENVAQKQSRSLPQWIIAMNDKGSS